jgi:DNA polymerase beta
MHPRHVHVPVPNISPPQLSLKSRIFNKAIRAVYVRAEDKKSSPLHNDVVPSLTERGILAASLSEGPKKWQGIVRIPEKDELDNGRHHRLAAIAEGTGTYKRIDLK